MRGNGHHHPVRGQLGERIDLIPAPDPEHRAADQEERTVGPDVGGQRVEPGRGQGPSPQPTQAAKRSHRIGGPAPEPRRDGDPLSDAHRQAPNLAASPQLGPQPPGRAMHEVVSPQRHAGRGTPNATVALERPQRERVVQIDGLQDGPQIVETVPAPAADPQIQIDLGVRPHRHPPGRPGRR